MKFTTFELYETYLMISNLQVLINKFDDIFSRYTENPCPVHLKIISNSLFTKSLKTRKIK